MRSFFTIIEKSRVMVFLLMRFPIRKASGMATDEGRESMLEAEDSFTKECMAFFDPIFRYVHASVRSMQDAEDLTQDVFVHAIATRDRFVQGDLRAWIYCIARNRVSSYYRRRGVENEGQRMLKLEWTRTGGRMGEAEEVRNEPDVQTTTRESLTALDLAMEELEPLEREAIRLKFSESFRNVQIAGLLGLTPGHLGVVLHRALGKLRRTMEDRGHG